jgi:mevalonate kinase
LQLKIYSLKWTFSRKSSGLDPLNSYLSIPILINSKIILKLQVFQIKLWTERRCVFVRFSCWRNYGHYLHGKPKDKGFRTMLKNQFVKYTDACVESFLGGDMKALFMNTKNYQA